MVYRAFLTSSQADSLLDGKKKRSCPSPILHLTSGWLSLDYIWWLLCATPNHQNPTPHDSRNRDSHNPVRAFPKDEDLKFRKQEVSATMPLYNTVGTHQSAREKKQLTCRESQRMRTRVTQMSGPRAWGQDAAESSRGSVLLRFPWVSLAQKSTIFLKLVEIGF